MQQTEEKQRMASEELMDKNNDESLKQSNYFHMIRRLRKDILCINKKIDALQRIFRNTNKLQYEEEKSSFYQTEKMLQEFKKFSDFEKIVTEDNKNMSQNMVYLLKNVKRKEKYNELQTGRIKLQKSLEEMESENNNDVSDTKLKDKLLVARFWNFFLRARMKKCMLGYNEYESAFDKIVKNTKETNIQEIMQKFMLREKTYHNLVERSNKLKQQVLDTMNLNKEYVDSLNSISNSQIEAHQTSESIESIKSEIMKLKENESLLTSKNKACNRCYEKIKIWVRKIKDKIEGQLKSNETKNIIDEINTNNIPKSFKIISHLICENAEKYDLKNKSLKNFMKEFLSDEFRQKTTRVNTNELNNTCLNNESAIRKLSFVKKSQLLNSSSNRLESEATIDIEKEQLYELIQFRKKLKDKNQEKVK